MQRDGREIARQNETKVLKALHKYGWLRTRDLAALIWGKDKARRPNGLEFAAVRVPDSARRMAQRTLSRLRDQHLVLWRQAPDGSLIYGMAEAGARYLADLGIPARSGKDQVRRVSLAHYHHRRLANEVAILAALQGYRVSTEAEIASGLWLGGIDGIGGKKPDVLIRQGRDAWWIEVERSRRNQPGYARLLAWLDALWPEPRRISEPAALPGDTRLMKVLFVCDSAFIDRLMTDLRQRGWTDEVIASRILAHRLLYVTEARFIVT